ncbi:haloacid dehalogenase-like hydrolase [uncultured Vibrio sp.]|uniref:haloacid dehalogenase-like hydrolase n=1 Tax=uncultured Vibrio sp. TaxID=114054 RepID=UPI000913E6BA|nr:haloacid dehalogenase-like hydrolase [uncultured Vibrio sp.]OIQ25180.1 MAG: hypothetical protein BM561_06610 [Vibrio sp. MedPE-SWchi]
MNNLKYWQGSSFINAVCEQLDKWTDSSSSDYLEPSERFAVFDLDGTLWCEKPLITEIAFWLHELKSVQENEQHGPFHSEIQALLEQAEDGKTSIVAETARLYHLVFPLQSSELYINKVREWLATTNHPRYRISHRKMVYQPMLSLLLLLQSHGFRCVIDTGSTNEFAIALCQDVLNLSDHDIIGSYRVMDNDSSSLVVNIGEVKVTQFKQRYDCAPVIAVGNTMHDLPLIKWANENAAAVTGFVHHDDNQREYQYDFDLKLKAYLSNPSSQSHTISMKRHWVEVFESDVVSADKGLVSQV